MGRKCSPRWRSGFCWRGAREGLPETLARSLKFAALKMRFWLFAQIRADGGGDGVGEMFDAGQLGTFDHDARQRFGAGEAHKDASGVAELDLRVADFAVGAVQFLQLALARDPH